MPVHHTRQACTPQQIHSATTPHLDSQRQKCCPHQHASSTARLQRSTRRRQRRTAHSVWSVRTQRHTDLRSRSHSFHQRGRLRCSYRAASPAHRGQLWGSGVVQSRRGRRTFLGAVRLWAAWRTSVFHRHRRWSMTEEPVARGQLVCRLLSVVVWIVMRRRVLNTYIVPTLHSLIRPFFHIRCSSTAKRQQLPAPLSNRPAAQTGKKWTLWELNPRPFTSTYHKMRSENHTPD